MAQFPSSLPVFNDFNPAHTLAQDNHAARHNAVHAETAAIAAKIGANGSADTNSFDYKLSAVTGANKAETQGNKKSSVDTSTTFYPTNKAVKDYVDAAIATAVVAAIITAKDQAKQESYPIGSLYYNADDSTNPGTLLGFGTWSAYATGRVPVGKATSGTFATPGATGGEETHTQTVAEMPSHFHVVTSRLNATNGADNGSAFGINQGGSGGSFFYNITGTVTTNADIRGTGVAVGALPTGGGSAFNVLQPYVVVYVWRRTA